MALMPDDDFSAFVKAIMNLNIGQWNGDIRQPDYFDMGTARQMAVDALDCWQKRIAGRGR
jgi:hypothetical protein